MSSKIDTVTITDLPNELYIGIFRRLDQSSLNNAVLTCKWWKQLIESSCLWSLDSRGNVNKCSKGYIDFMLNTNRRFHTMQFYFNVTYETSIKIFWKHGSKVKKLFLFNYILEKFEHFTEIMKCFPNLEHLMIFEVMKQLRCDHLSSDINGPTSDIDVPSSNIDAPEMIKLKRLDVVRSPLGILKYFSRSKLKIIKIFSSAYDDPDTIPKPLTDFLKSQHHLTTISLESINHEDQLFRTDKLNEVVPFQLKKLSLRKFDLEASQEQYNNLIEFMKMHARTIHELEFGGKFPDYIYKFVFTKLKNLQSLEMNIDEIPSETKFYDNPSIKNLSLTRNKSIGCQALLKELIKQVPNVTNLTLGGYFGRAAVLLIANNMKKITRIAVDTFTGRNFERVQFQQLTSLIISQLNCHVGFDWDQFTRDNFRITELVIANCGGLRKFNHDDVEQISNNLKLQTLTIAFGFSVDQHFFDIIRKNCPDLKKFNLDKSCFTDSLSGLADVPGLRTYQTERNSREDEIYSNYIETNWDNDDYAEIDYESDEANMDIDVDNVEVDEDNMEVDEDD